MVREGLGTAAVSRRILLFVVETFHWVTGANPDLRVKIRSDVVFEWRLRVDSLLPWLTVFAVTTWGRNEVAV